MQCAISSDDAMALQKHEELSLPIWQKLLHKCQQDVQARQERNDPEQFTENSSLHIKTGCSAFKIRLVKEKKAVAQLATSAR